MSQLMGCFLPPLAVILDHPVQFFCDLHVPGNFSNVLKKNLINCFLFQEKDSHNHLKVLNGNKNVAMSQNGNPTKRCSKQRKESLNPMNLMISVSETSINSYFPHTQTEPLSPAVKKQPNNFINVQNFLKKAHGNYVKVDTLHVRVCNSESEKCLHETSLICSEKPAEQIESNLDPLEAPNKAQQCNYVEHVEENHSTKLTMDKASEGDSIIPSSSKSVDQLTKPEMVLKAKWKNASSPAPSLSLPEIVGRREILV